MRSRRVRDGDGVVRGRTKIITQTACGKQGYTSRKVAKNRAAIARHETGEPIHAYKCVACHLHHIGHPLGWRAAHPEAS